MKKSLILGLLGGIGSGKSLVASILSRLGAHVLDADLKAKELLEDPEVRREIRNAFGERVFLPDGRVDKSKMADRIFTQESDRKTLNAIIHPRVRKHIREEVAALRRCDSKKVIVLDIPLILGSELESLCDLMVMVSASRITRFDRVRKAREWEAGELERREICQPTIEKKAAAAHITIDNEGTIEELESKVTTFFKDLITKIDPS